MLVDWFTVGAQVINFLVLVWLLKRYLYQPILSAIDQREKAIAAKMADADAKVAQADRERDEFQHKNEEIERHRAGLLAKARDEVSTEQARLLEESRQEVDALTSRRREMLRSEAHHLNQAISRRMRQEVFAIARKALAGLATTSLEERLGEVFTRRLRELDGNSKSELGQALKSARSPALVYSALDLPDDQRVAIQTALNETFSAEVPVRFLTSPDLICGISLVANGQKVSWNVDDYLETLEADVEALINGELPMNGRSPMEPTGDSPVGPSEIEAVRP